MSSIPNITSLPNEETKHYIQINLNNIDDTEPHESFLVQEHEGEQEEDEGEILGLILKRSRSRLPTCFVGLRGEKEMMSSSSSSSVQLDDSEAIIGSYSMRVDKDNSLVESALRRAFSMRVSSSSSSSSSRPLSSASHSYCRIDHEYDTLVGDEENLMAKQPPPKKRSGNFREACRRFFGF